MSSNDNITEVQGDNGVVTPISPSDAALRINDPDYYSRVDRIGTKMATETVEFMGNVAKNVALGLPKMHLLPGFKVLKGDDKKIALVGGGPSIEQTNHELREYETIVACGSSYDYLRTKHIIPHVCVICDPDPISAQYIKKAHPATKFFIASHCNPIIFEKLKRYETYIWHCFSDNPEDYLKIEPGGFQAVGGGCTVGLRALAIVIMFGYTNIHFYGFDSCLGDKDKPYAYNFATNMEETGKVYSLRIGDENGPKSKLYNLAGYHLAQANNFKDFYARFGRGCAPNNLGFIATFHGDGLLTELHEYIKRDVAMLAAKARLEDATATA